MLDSSERVGSALRWHDRLIRIGTWNLAGKEYASQRFLESLRCDVWLFTEVHDRFQLSGGEMIRSSPMRDFKAYAAVWSNRPMQAMPAPHEGSVAAVLGDVLLCSSVLPWYACRSVWPDKGPDIPTITVKTLDRIRPHLESHAQVVWGGDFNNTLMGPHGPGTKRGRKEIQRLADDLALQVLTTELPHTMPGRCSIDHIAVPTSWSVDDCFAVVAEHEGVRLGDHNAYVAEVARRQ